MNKATIKRPPFIIFALPRSRTAWLSHWLSYIQDGSRVRAVGHDAFSGCSSIEECIDLFDGKEDGWQGILDGTCETGAAFAFEIIKRELPSAKFLVVQRDPMDSLRSLIKAGVIPRPEDWSQRVKDIWAISASGIRTISYEDLNLESCAQWMWDYLLGLPWDRQWWVQWTGTNVQVQMGERLRELDRNALQIEALKSEVRNERAHLSL